MDRIKGILDIANSIGVVQLIFFTLYLYIKGNRIPSTFFLKLHLLFQLTGYISYIYWTRELTFVRPMLVISVPSMFTWGPTFYFYIRSRLYKNFIPEWKLMIHAIPFFISVLFILPVMIEGDNFSDNIAKLGQKIFYFSKIQILIYNIYTFIIIFRYKKEIEFFTSSSEKRKINWLIFLTYGLTITSLTDFLLYLIPDFTNVGLGYIIFLIFLNLFFFKAIINPDQFLGLDEISLIPVKLSPKKLGNHFREINDIIDKNQLFLDPDLSLHNVAQAVKLSDRIVSQAIKQAINLNFCDYINKKRIEYAKERLSSTTKAERNVLEILYEAGFNSKSVFNSQFKKHTGYSPTIFREMIRGNTPSK